MITLYFRGSFGADFRTFLLWFCLCSCAILLYVMLVVDMSAPVYERSVQQTGDEEDQVAAYYDGHKCTDVIYSVECTECVKYRIHQLGYHSGAVVSDP